MVSGCLGVEWSGTVVCNVLLYIGGGGTVMSGCLGGGAIDIFISGAKLC